MLALIVSSLTRRPHTVSRSSCFDTTWPAREQRKTSSCIKSGSKRPARDGERREPSAAITVHSLRWKPFNSHLSPSRFAAPNTTVLAFPNLSSHRFPASFQASLSSLPWTDHSVLSLAQSISKPIPERLLVSAA